MRTVVSGEAWVLKREERLLMCVNDDMIVGAGWVGLCQTQWWPGRAPCTDP